jgi:hypothetical protein
LDAVLVCCSFVLIFAIFSLIGCFRFIFGIWRSLDLYFGTIITIKYYVSLHSIDDMYYTNTIKPENKRKTPNPTKPFLTSKRHIHQQAIGRRTHEPNRKNHKPS